MATQSFFSSGGRPTERLHFSQEIAALSFSPSSTHIEINMPQTRHYLPTLHTPSPLLKSTAQTQVLCRVDSIPKLEPQGHAFALTAARGTLL